MTKRQMEQIVKEWIPRLGLTHWEIEVRWDQNGDGFPEWRSEHHKAATWRARDYETARVYFNPDLIGKWSLREAHSTAVHELLHLVTREIEFVLDMLDGHLHRDLESLVVTTFQHHVEGAIDRLAWRIVDLVGVS